ncbi:MAG: SRPBCC domain-containing protein [Acidimicrobiales bacterium]|nr:SRPBCC domain-containing protein [Acidimicrobiales bacterium]
MKLVDRTISIAAPPSDVYALLTQADLLVEWMAPIASLDPRPGGEVSWTHANGNTVRGQYVELVPDRRVVFTYGWERADVGVPPGSTVVEIDLRPTAGGTELRLVHRGLEGPMADAHAGGWANYLARLAARAAGTDPGPDPLADGRVPTSAELGLA